MTASRSSFWIRPSVLQAEVVRELAHLVVALALDLADELGEQALAEPARRLEALLVDAGDERGVLLVQLAALEQRRRGRGSGAS